MFDKYPYTDFHELNLDWIIAQVKEVTKEMDTFKVINTITWDGVHDITKEYAAWTIVDTTSHSGYISIKAVPAGVLLTNTDYWQQVADYSALYADIQTAIAELRQKYVYTPSDLVESTTNIGLKTGTYTLTADMTIEHQIVIPEGAVINIPEGITLTITGDIVAGRYQIFTGDGTVQGGNQTAFPEWFGDDLIKTYAAFNIISLARKDYFLTSDLHIDRTDSMIYGALPSTYWDSSNYGSRIICTNNAKIYVGLADSYVPNNFPRNITFKDFEIWQRSENNQSGLEVFGVVYGLFENLTVYVFDSCLKGIWINKAISTKFINCRIQITGCNSTFHGFYCYSPSPILAGNNASLYFDKCFVSSEEQASGGVSDGWYLQGASADTYLSQCETARTDVGFYLSGSDTANGFNDIMLIGCIFDACRNRCLMFENISTQGQIDVISCYAAKDSTNNPTNSILFISSCTCSFNINGFQALALNASNLGIQFYNGAPAAIVTGAICNGMDTAITMYGVDTSKIKYQLLHNSVIESN